MEKEQVFLNAYHMVKLARNTLHDYGSSIDNEGHPVKWQEIYISIFTVKKKNKKKIIKQSFC